MTKKKTKTKKKTTRSAGKGPVIIPYPEAGHKVLEFEKKLDEQLAGADEQTKRGPGRPRNEPEPQPSQGPALTDTAILAGVKLPFALWAEKNKLEELKLSEPEARELAVATKALMDYYFPELPPVVLLWGNFSLTAYSIVQLRLMIINQIKKEKSVVSPDGVPAGAPKPGPQGPGPAGMPAADDTGDTGFPTLESLPGKR